jgi:hypothetical protein
MGADKTPLELLLDLTVYAPLGLAVTARERLPELIEKGRRYVGTQINSTRVAGTAAAPTAGQATPGEPPIAADTPSPPPAPSPSPSPAPSSGHLAIPGYDSLSASQVVQRLAGLSADELEAVRAYEVGTRGRRTILTRVAQLQES